MTPFVLFNYFNKDPIIFNFFKTCAHFIPITLVITCLLSNRKYTRCSWTWTLKIRRIPSKVALDIFLFQVIHLHWCYHEFHHSMNYSWSQPINSSNYLLCMNNKVSFLLLCCRNASSALRWQLIGITYFETLRPSKSLKFKPRYVQQMVYVAFMWNCPTWINVINVIKIIYLDMIDYDYNVSFDGVINNIYTI